MHTESLQAPTAAALRHLVLDLGVRRNKRLAPVQPPSVEDCVSPMGHPAGTCVIGRADNGQAAVDAHCKLHRLSGPYIADASVIPVLPSANTNLPTMMVTERVADWLGARNCSLWFRSGPGHAL